MFDFQDLYKTYVPDVYRFAYWLCGDTVDAEDITSETFLRAWKHRERIRTETMKAYLLSIARNLYLERLRKHKLHAELSDRFSQILNLTPLKGEQLAKVFTFRIFNGL